MNKGDLEDRNLAQDLDVDDRLYSLNVQDCFISVKDHKDNFENNTQCRLLNPSKSELGKISKKILAKLVKVVREQTMFNHWENTTSVITWFKHLENKNNLSFLQFDIVEFYPSITENLLKRALDYAKEYVEISKDDRRCVLYFYVL